jgi:alpha-tubulin suppressor-like RCC1 family protein
MRRRTGTLLVALASGVSASCTALLGIDGDYRPASDAGIAADATTDGPSTMDVLATRDAGPDATGTPDGDAMVPTEAAIDAGSVVAITAGRFYTCALYGGGVAKCWGQNVAGEFGNGSTVSSALPVAAMGSGITALYGGNTDTCAVLSGGKGACAGYGGEGQLLDGVPDADSPVPIATSALPAVPSAFASGSRFTCAVVSGGDVYCAGDGTLGQLGNGAQAITATAVQANLGGAKASGVAAGLQHACAITTTGAVLCWGDDSSGQLGDGNTSDGGVPVPVTVSLPGAATEIGLGSAHSCAIVQGTSGGVWCWGSNAHGQLGDGTMNPSATPVAVKNVPPEVAHLAVGDSHACVSLVNAGGAMCWGKGGSGELGNGDTKDQPTPVAVMGIQGAPIAMAAGGFHSCAMVAAPNVLCWGANDFGQLGNNDPMAAQQNAPVAVVPLVPF